MFREPSEDLRERGSDQVPPSISLESFSFRHLDHKCFQTAHGFGFPSLSFSVTALGLVSFPFLPQYLLGYYRLQKGTSLTPRFLMVLLIFLLGQFKTNPGQSLWGQEGYCQEGNIPFKPLLFFHRLWLPQLPTFLVLS